MGEPRYVLLCGGAAPAGCRQGKKILLSPDGPNRTHRLELDNVHRNFAAAVPARIADLVEIAAYVYAADALISRGGATGRDFGAHWRRRLHFVAPVRDVDCWRDPAVQGALVQTLEFLSDDDYSFEFTEFTEDEKLQSELGLEDIDFGNRHFDRVVLFSGGVDSLGGAIEEIARHGRRVLLLNHRSSSKMQATTSRLLDELGVRFGRDSVHGIRALMNVVDGATKERTRRSRSFLFAALAVAAASVAGVDRISFYENGVVSLNLPISGQVIGARATRTTHPRFIRDLSRFLSALLDRPFFAENGYIWRTKAEVMNGVVEAGHADLLALTNSCASVYNRTEMFPHCGVCSQCIDRAFAARAAGCAEHVPETDYEVALFDGPRSTPEHRELAAGYIGFAREALQIDDRAFFARYPEATRVVDCFDEPAEVIGGRIYDLHQRHAGAVCRVLEDEVRDRPEDFARQRVTPDSLLAMIGESAAGAVARSSSLFEALNDQRHVTSCGPENPDPRLMLRLGPTGRTVTIEDVGEISGVGGELLTVLVGHHCKADAQSSDPTAHGYLPSGEIQEHFDVGDETLRARVSRLRRAIKQALEQAGRSDLLIYEVVESSPWHGYRLNPDIVRVENVGE